MKKIADICEVCGGKFHGTFRENGKEMYLCNKHLHHMQRHRIILKRTRVDRNEIITLGNISEIILYNRRNIEVFRETIDSDIVDKIKEHKWTAVKKGKSVYVKTDININKKRYTLYLPNLIIGTKDGYQVDHISGDTLDNRRINLRFATQHQNLLNKSKAKGYSRNKRGMWHTYITLNNKRTNLGYFSTEEEAKIVRRDAELKYFGEFAKKEK